MKPFYQFEGTNLLELMKSKILSKPYFNISSNAFEIREVEDKFEVILSFKMNPHENGCAISTVLNSIFKAAIVQPTLVFPIAKFSNLEDAKAIVSRKVPTMSWSCDRLSIFRTSFMGGKFVTEEVEGLPLVKVVNRTVETENIPNSETYRFQDGAWKKAVGSVNNLTLSNISVVTFNVLFDIFGNHITYVSEREEGIYKILKGTNADIIGLQEVTPRFLAQLLELDWVQENYYISCHTDEISPLTPYGQLFLSKFPFTIQHVPFTKHKRIAIAQLLVNNNPLFLINLHMPSYYKNEEETLKLKKLMVSTIDRLVERNKNANAYIFGDFNFNDEEEESRIISKGLIDSWTSLYPNEEGFTFDTYINTIAQMLTKRGYSKRYDRIYYHESSTLVPSNVSIIGNKGWDIVDSNGEKVKIFASDHFGLLGNLTFITQESEVSSPNVQYKAAKPVKFLEDSFYTRLQKLGIIDDYASDASELINTLNGFHKEFFGANSFMLLQVGSTALNVRTQNSDIDLLCVSVFTPEQYFLPFYEFLRTKKDTIRHRRYIKESLVPVLEINLFGTLVDIQYCQWKGSMNPTKLLSPNNLKTLEKKSYLAAKSFVDTQKLINAIPSLSTFRPAYLFVKKWAINRGIYSNRFGFFGGYGLSILVAKTCCMFPKATSQEVVEHFFKMYASWNWDVDPIALYDDKNMKFDPGKINIMTISAPYLNSTRNSTYSTRTVLIRELERAHSLISQDKLSEVVDTLNLETQYSSYLQVIVTAPYQKDHYLWSNYVESRIVDLVNTLEDLPLFIHPIPHAYNFDAGRDVGSFYLLGLEVRKDKIKPEMDTDMSPIINRSISKMLSWSDISGGMFVEVKRKRYSNIGDLTFFDPSFVDVSDEDEDDMLVVDENVSSDEESLVVRNERNTKEKKKEKYEVLSQKKKRFRTSEEVYNQVRWDNKYSTLDFIIGYEDRFVGIIEVPFDKFRADPDIFIPWHRVWYFKRRGDIIWDRKERIDLISQK